jgi:hypothetical protein
LAKDVDDFLFDGTPINESQLPGASAQRCAGRRDRYREESSRHRNCSRLHSWRCQRPILQCRRSGQQT